MFESAEKEFILPIDFALPEVTLPAVLSTDVAALTALLHTQQQAYEASQMAARNVISQARDEISQAHNEISQAHNEISQARDEIRRLIEQIILARRRQFGPSSEQMSGQGRLFDEAEVLAEATTEVEDIAPLAPKSEGQEKPARGKRSPLPAELKRVEIVYDVPEAERTCACGTPMVVIGQDVSEQLDIVPMQIRVLRHIRMRYGCPSSVHAPVTAPLPPQPLPKSNASANFLAMLLTVKFVDGLPLTRFAKVLDRHGMSVPTQTLARWVISCGSVLQPLHNLIRDTLLESSVLHIDETVVQVLKEPNKTPTSNSYMWVQTGGPPGKPVVIYDYDPSRGREVPVRLLHDYRGYLMTDGYDAYNKLTEIEGIEHLMCWAHVRRRYIEAVNVQPKGKSGHADEAIKMIRQLYRIERDHKDADDEARLKARKKLSIPILDKLYAWMEKLRPGVTPKSALGGALKYMHDNWSMLKRYTERGDLPIDNNRCENAIRPFVVGRKAWLFSNTTAGAHASAVIYSLVETAKANGLEPYLWLRYVLHELPAAKTVEDVEALLPWNFNPLTNIS
ncbi:IS66 family transposase [Mycoavidus sp. HKI]|uniref:IS66 family transposase n=1 Tax=Mycoavidus sp. HKI TaxID=2840467 RepID=UPI001CBF29A8|nr:IS66 family transposase [Mycoavidus sp. HKI]UAW63379.1 IS66 family transposase [Mycoavidus sp. HKI]UAW64715.1 IS66 family transposase [Mycoavidus sp. HKI]UAW64887.1 IS66 family transposase [Mycoavidus sp. HKI]